MALPNSRTHGLINRFLINYFIRLISHSGTLMETNSAPQALIVLHLNKHTEWLLDLILLDTSLSLFFKVGFIPGDLVDARFNMYILEHGYRWLLRLDNPSGILRFFTPHPIRLSSPTTTWESSSFTHYFAC